MIKFKPCDDNRQFISILIEDGTDTRQVLDYITNRYESIKQHNCIMDSDEILLELTNNCNYGFPLNALRSTVSEISKAVITAFCVDSEEPMGRYIGK